MPHVLGVDVSKYQGKIDHARVAAAGYKFAIVRVSDGVKWPDAYCAANLRGFEAAGMSVGAYQYFRAGHDVAEQVRIVADKVPLGTVVAHDVENRDKQDPWTVLCRSREWCDLMTETVRAPLLYTMPNFMVELTRDTQAWLKEAGTNYAHLDLWVAHWIEEWEHSRPAAFPGWPVEKSPRIWQVTDKALVPGIMGPMDVNVWYGSESELRAYFAREGV